MPRYTIRYTPDGDGWWYEVRDHHGTEVARAFRPGAKSYARDEARRVRDNVRRNRTAA